MKAMSDKDYFRCEVCGAQLMFSDSSNETKFPVVRRFEDQNQKKGLLSVRCAQCVGLPYILEEGQPFRSDMIGRSETTVVSGCNSVYNYWPDVGHLLEVYISSPDSEHLAFLQTAPIELGFLVEEEVNLIVIAYRFQPHNWNVTPYLWHAYPEFHRAYPPENPGESEKFTVATVDDKGGTYRSIRVGALPEEFATKLSEAIAAQILRGKPGQEYERRTSGLWSLLVENKVESLLQNRAVI